MLVATSTISKISKRKKIGIIKGQASKQGNKLKQKESTLK